MTKDEIILAQQARVEQLLGALIKIKPFIPTTSAADGGAAKYSAHVEAADSVRHAISAKDDLSALREHDAELLADANRYRWLRKYMASSRTDLDDALVEACSSDNPDELDVMIDLYEAIEKGGV